MFTPAKLDGPIGVRIFDPETVGLSLRPLAAGGLGAGVAALISPRACVSRPLHLIQFEQREGRNHGAAIQEASLAENFQRLSMNPADECVAFSALVKQGSDAEGSPAGSG
jgi:hypothetical protein